jgi:hypothetical protein
VKRRNAVDDVLDRVADGAEVDWEAAQKRAASPEESAMVRNLRLLAKLGDTHRDEPIDDATDARDADARNADPQGTRLEPESEAGTQWGRYRLIRAIGRGSFGAVYLARDEQLDREVALKLLHPGLVARADVKSEGRALARVDHTNVLTVYGVEEHDGRLALCMKYVRGRTLEEIIRTDGPMNADEALVVGKAMCNAVAAVHAAGVLHRDIKARNVMRERNGRYILMDFGAGVMQRADGSSGTSATVGTPLYMAPELFDGQPASRSTDVYALGVLLYFLVSGEYPVWGATIEELKAAHRTQKSTRLDDRRLDLPLTYTRAVDRATSRNPSDRPESATALLRELLATDEADGSTRAPRTLAQRLGRGVAVLGIMIVCLTALGFINSTEFNVMFERTQIVSESVLDWLTWGIRSMIGPVINLAQMLIVVLLIATIARFVRRLFPPVDRGWKKAASWLQELRRRLLLDDPEAFAQMIFVLAVAYVAVVVWLHRDVIAALTTPLSSLTHEQMRLLSPSAGYTSRPVWYRNALDWAVLGTGWATLRMIRMRRASARAVHPVYVAAVAAVFVLSTILWNAPYRVMFQSQLPRVDYAALRCYKLGASVTETLLFCPDAPQPRVRRVPAADARLKDTGVTESVFATP